MKKHNKTYDALEFESGLLRSTIKAWRSQNILSLQSAEAALGSFGWTLVPCPPLRDLPDAVLDKAEEFGQAFRSDDEMLATIVAAACELKTWRDARDARLAATAELVASQELEPTT
jgi:hypothetical protein